MNSFARAVIDAGFTGRTASRLEPKDISSPGVATGWKVVTDTWIPEGTAVKERYGSIGSDANPNNKVGGHANGPWSKAHEVVLDNRLDLEFDKNDQWIFFDLNYADGLSKWIWLRAIDKGIVKPEDAPQQGGSVSPPSVPPGVGAPPVVVPPAPSPSVPPVPSPVPPSVSVQAQALIAVRAVAEAFKRDMPSSTEGGPKYLKLHVRATQALDDITAICQDALR